jgi:transcriptional regulator of arginine metabolism
MRPASPTLRRTRILERLRAGLVPSQEALRRALAADGIEVTQATLSRDLRTLGVVKGPEGYRPPPNGAPSPPSSRPAPPAAFVEFERLARPFLVSAERIDRFVVLKTPPGNAHALASALDRVGLPGIAGTLAGDDTIFVLARRLSGAKELMRLTPAAARK